MPEQVPAQTTEQPQAPTSNYPMSDSSGLEPFEVGDWDIGFDEESGDMRINARNPQTPTPPALPVDEEVMDGQGGGGGNAQAQAFNPQQRIEQLESVATQLIQLVTAMANGQMPPQQQQAQPPVREYDLNDPTQLQHFIAETVQKAVENTTAPFMRAIPHIAQRLDYQDHLQMHGDDFNRSLPAIKVLLESDANLTIEKAYKIVKSIEAINGKSAGQHSTPRQAPKQQGPAQTLITKANRLQTESGMNGSFRTSRQINSLRDALEAAIESESGG